MRSRRYEILLPLMHNDGRPVDPEKFSQTLEELLTELGAVSISPHAVRGIWVHEGARYEEESRRIEINVEDSSACAEFFVALKATLTERFEQIEIYIVSYPIDVL